MKLSTSWQDACSYRDRHQAPSGRVFSFHLAGTPCRLRDDRGICGRRGAPASCWIRESDSEGVSVEVKKSMVTFMEGKLSRSTMLEISGHPAFVFGHGVMTFM